MSYCNHCGKIKKVESTIKRKALFSRAKKETRDAYDSINDIKREIHLSLHGIYKEIEQEEKSLHLEGDFQKVTELLDKVAYILANLGTALEHGE